MRTTLTALLCLATGLTACHGPDAATNTSAATTNMTAAPTTVPSGPASIDGAPKTADGRAAKVLQQAQISAVLQQAPTSIRGNGTFVVDGDQSFDGWYLAADKIEFKPGATLTFSPQAVQSRRNFFVIAKRVVSDDPQKPGSIRFAAPQVGPANASAGQAATGHHATGGGGAAGGAGTDGAAGVTGPTGLNAPNLTLVTLSIPGSGPVVDFRGGQGGAGGQGQQGGDGGNGAVGVPASQTMFGCSHGAGRGGAGGAGGHGGAGGLGGPGGGGGTVTVMAPGDKVPTILQKLRVMTSGGPGGAGGLPGKGGNGGGGGQGGAKSLPFCQGDGQTGDNGPAGEAGGPGQPGSTGLDGDLFVGSITEADFERLYSGS